MTIDVTFDGPKFIEDVNLIEELQTKLGEAAETVARRNRSATVEFHPDGTCDISIRDPSDGHVTQSWPESW